MKSTSVLPENRKSFDISVKGDTSGQLFTGKFVTVCMPSLRQKSQAAIMEAQLNRDLRNLDESTVLYHRVVAQLGQRIVEAPEWFISSAAGQDLLDVNVLLEIWGQCAKAEDEWRLAVWGKPEEAKPEVKPTDEKPE